jgi:IS5 family transposase
MRPVRGWEWTTREVFDSLVLVVDRGEHVAALDRQEAFAFGRSGVGRRSSLDDLRDLIDWAPIERQLSVVSCSAKGEPAWPPLALFKAMLLAMWYDLSDVKLAEALYDRASFRRYCGFSTSEATPERTTFVRFRKALVTQALDKALFDEITAQLKAKAIRVKTGTLVDATVIASASEEDGEARWVKHKGRAAVHGFKAHVGADANTALVEEVAVTPANVNDGKAGPDALPDAPGEVFADSAYRGKTFREAVRVKGGSLRVAVTGMWGRDEAETLARLEAWNQPIHRIRGRIEKIFGTWKRSYGLRRMARTGEGRSADPLHRNRVQHQALFQDSRPGLTTPPKGFGRPGNIAAHFSGRRSPGKASRITENDDSRTGLLTLRESVHTLLEPRNSSRTTRCLD